MLDRIKADIKTSLLAGDRFRVDTLKMAQSALDNARIEKRSDLSDEEAVRVIQKEIKKRKEAAQMYEEAGETDRANKETQEVEILGVYVPEQLSGPKLEELVDEFLKGKTDISFGEAMQSCVTSFGNVDRAELAALLKTKLS